mmetsp:Transcript_15380/g.31525  ORF Transcript_15380/g.31525 Transcript_15380/m.31525 type:complete len:221 (-) Transcript_15380:548-1210(-)
MLKSGLLNSSNVHSYQPIKHHCSRSGQDKASVAVFPRNISINHQSTGLVTNQMDLQFSKMIVLRCVARSIFKIHSHLPIRILDSAVKLDIFTGIITAHMLNNKTILLPLIKQLSCRFNHSIPFFFSNHSAKPQPEYSSTITRRFFFRTNGVSSLSLGGRIDLISKYTLFKGPVAFTASLDLETFFCLPLPLAQDSQTPRVPRERVQPSILAVFRVAASLA